MKSSYWSTWKPNLSFLACRTVRTLKINKLLQAYDINSMPLVYVIPEKHSKCDESKCGTHWRSNWARRSTLALWINIHFRRLITDFELLLQLLIITPKVFTGCPPRPPMYCGLPSAPKMRPGSPFCPWTKQTGLNVKFTNTTGKERILSVIFLE